MISKINQAINRCVHIFLIRNKYYGNSFSGHESFSVVAIPPSSKVMVRMEDKLKRLANLIKDEESNTTRIVDTLIDLTNYAIIDKMLLIAEKEPDKTFSEIYPNDPGTFRLFIKNLEHEYDGQCGDRQSTYQNILEQWSKVDQKPISSMEKVAYNSLILAILYANHDFDYYFNSERDDEE